MRKLVEPTFYLDKVDTSQTFCDKVKNDWDKYEDNFCLNLVDHNCFNEVHDIYDPSFSSGENFYVPQECENELRVAKVDQHLDKVEDPS